VHAGPVADTLRKFGLHAEAHNNLSWDDLRAEIHAGRPVIVWVIWQMWGGTSVEYTAPDGSTSRVVNYEHTMILTGYSQDSVQVVDAYSGLYQTYWLSTFLRSWAVLGNMAVFISLEPGMAVDAPVEAYTETYTVQPGDFLIALAESIGSSWEKLAEFNSIGYPYIIYPGEVLQLSDREVKETGGEISEPITTHKTVNFIIHLPIVQGLTIPDVLPPQ
jgi:hypothetical protein